MIWLLGGFGNHCSIHQLYRYLLCQFELQTYLTHQKSVDFYPFQDDAVHMEEGLRTAVKGNLANFCAITALIESYSHFKFGEQPYCTLVPPDEVINPHTIRIANLRDVVNLAVNANPAFVAANSIPEAIFNPAGVLQNGDEIMPAVYGEAEFHEDAMAVRAGISSLKGKFLSYSAEMNCAGVGNASIFVSTTSTCVIPPIPPVGAPNVIARRGACQVPLAQAVG